MIDRRYHRSLQVFSWVACAAMTAKLVLFTEWGTRRGDGKRPHVFTGIQQYTDKKLDEFFGVEAIKPQAPGAAAAAPQRDDTASSSANASDKK